MNYFVRERFRRVTKSRPHVFLGDTVRVADLLDVHPAYQRSYDYLQRNTSPLDYGLTAENSRINVYALLPISFDRHP